MFSKYLAFTDQGKGAQLKQSAVITSNARTQAPTVSFLKLLLQLLLNGGFSSQIGICRWQGYPRKITAFDSIYFSWYPMLFLMYVALCM